MFEPIFEISEALGDSKMFLYAAAALVIIGIGAAVYTWVVAKAARDEYEKEVLGAGGGRSPYYNVPKPHYLNNS